MTQSNAFNIISQGQENI